MQDDLGPRLGPRDDSEKPAGAGRGMLVAIAAILVLVIGGGLLAALWPFGGAVTPARRPPAEAAIGPDPAKLEEARKAVAGLRKVADYAPFYALLAERFPTDSAQSLDSFADRWLADRTSAGAERHLSDTLKALRQARGLMAAKADTGPLGRVFDAQAAMLDALRAEDPRLCVDFLYGGATDAFLAFAARNRRLMAEMAQASLAAILDGQAKRNDRTPPTDADFRTLEQALTAAGLSKVEIDALLDGKSADPPLPDDAMCDAGRTYLKTLKALPEDVRLKIYGLAVELMARS